MKLVTYFIFIMAFSISGLAADPYALITDQVKAILSKGDAKVSFSLRDLKGIEVVGFKSETPLMPASIAKTVSTACSLDQLGPQFQFETVFAMTGKLVGDTLEGDLVIQGGGDPGLVIEDLREIVEKIRFLYGIKKITGNLIFDVSYFGEKSFSINGGFEGDEGRSFAAPLTPVSMNQNSFSFWMAPDPRGTRKVLLTTLPANVMDVQVSNKAKVGSTNNLSVSFNAKTLQATVAGSIAEDSEPKGIYRAVDDAYVYALNLMLRLWKDSGGEWKDPTFKISNTRVSAKMLWRHSSRPLSKILMDVNKLSLNMGAEMILLAAGADKFSKPASFEKSMKLIKECILAHKIKPGDISLTNASGLSRESSLKTSALSQFLVEYSHSLYWPEYLSSFGLLGLDGTSKSRLKNFEGRARLKTGSLKNVRSIAGYVYSKDHQAFAFAMIQNTTQATDAKKREDKVLEAFMNGL